MLYIFKERSTYPITGGSPDDFKTTTQPISNSIGLYHRSMAVIDFGSGDMLVGLAKDGFFAFDGYTYKNLGVQKEVGINIQSFIDGLDKNKLQNANGYNDIAKGQYRCFVTESGIGYNNKELVWDYRQNKITIFNRCGNVVLDWNNQILFGSSLTDGKVHKIGGLNDNGSAISIKAEFPWWNLGGNYYARFRFLNVETTLQGLYSPTITSYMDGLSVANPLDLYTDPIVTSSVNTTFTATTVTDASALDLSEVVIGMFAVTPDNASYGVITAIDDVLNKLTVEDWEGAGTPANGTQIEVRGTSWGSEAWVTEGTTYRVTKTLDTIGSDGLSFRGGNIKHKLTHAGLNQPVTLNALTQFYTLEKQVRSFITAEPLIEAGAG